MQARPQGAPQGHLPSSSGGSRQGPAQSRAGPRIFVGKLPREVGEADVREYFGQFGFVLDVYLPRDKANRREHRGFGFVTYETEAAVRRVVSRGSHQIKGVYVAIDAAEPRGDEGGRSEEGAEEAGLVAASSLAAVSGAHAAMDAGGLDDALEQRQHRRNLFLGGLAAAEPEADALKALTRLGLESVPEDR
ncbi:hypothetical protein H632_c1522p0 [Helicosporidium sp. ATCC 50920]|nr:hypothetical protein H632_c1522p0 [Helicosporidium sp. ATCC 50920]|eukprot:KDD74158.1 hypothetical protein H632_c1522p0 [Helicosporidium sp. ATCC 50920]